MRYKCTVEYDGTPFCGWQRQNDALSVQQAIEGAIKLFCGIDATIIAAGRTDAGVHAEGQVFHVDLPEEFREDTVRDAINFHLRPHPVAVIAAEKAPDDFHARFSATKRAYRYEILCRRGGSPLLKGRVWERSGGLDIAAMQDAGARLVGHHDFNSFRSGECQSKSSVKTLDSLLIDANDRGARGTAIRIYVEAPSFLHNMIRIIVGSLAEVGKGARPPAWIDEALAAKHRSAAGPTAPACGLYFVRAEYGENAAG